MIPVISVVGKSNAGKTTFLVGLIAELKKRGWRVAVIKHNVHDFEIDHPGKDTYRHAGAGADVVAIASPHKMAVVKKLEAEMSVQDVIAAIGPGYDIILTEGYKRGPYPKVEVSRKAVSEELLSSEMELVAVVTDNIFPVDRPHFALDDAFGVADLLEDEFIKTKGKHGRALR
ncbi:MAG: molybdopterin-guanine dinucleotide biosynthesis protein B [Candidatus Aquicultor sp.]